MPDSPANIDLSALNLDQTTLKTIERLLNDIESLINKEPQDAINLLYKLKHEITQLKSQKNQSDTNLIHANTDELRRAFHAHCGTVSTKKKKSASLYLLTFYAVECGFKSIWLRRNRLNGTNEIQDKTLITKDGHNFAIWIKELRLPATIVGNYPNFSKIPSFRLSRDKSSWDTGKAHQAWRYGVEMNIEDEKILVEWLHSICTWIEDTL